MTCILIFILELRLWKVGVCAKGNQNICKEEKMQRQIKIIFHNIQCLVFNNVVPGKYPICKL